MKDRSTRFLLVLTILLQTTQQLYAQNNTGSDALFISDNGRVGIGTNDPVSELEVKGDIKLGLDKKIWWDWPNRNIEVLNMSDNVSRVMRFRNAMGVINPLGGFDFADHDGRTVIRINDYKVGINNADPKVDLDVKGEVKITGEAKITGKVETGNLEVKGDIKSTGRIKDQAGYLIPQGGIIMYSGDKNNFADGIGKAGTPVEGWALCDGKSNRPDLRNRFVVGGGDGSEYNVGATGGEKQHTLNIDEMPSHQHTWGLGGGNWWHDTNVSKGSAEGNRCKDCAWDVKTSAAGGGKPHENRPPYYAVLYIIKL